MSIKHPIFQKAFANTVSPCELVHCFNDGNCSVSGEIAICTCHTGFGGLRCEGVLELDKNDSAVPEQYKQAQGNCHKLNKLDAISMLTSETECRTRQASMSLSRKISFCFSVANQNNSTSSIGTGPSSAYTGDNYLYFEATSVTQGSVARLLSRDFIFESSGCLKFHYHMYGSAMGTLNVYQGSRRIWRKAGNQGNQWRLVEISLQANNFSSSNSVVNLKRKLSTN
ncbi:unnamed protein product [Mytilus edulis]|uniref:EGF-like domain-containing protein n=1 Tax=Mytilus edulis TaxID=6550 RepID=A0A8S3QI92_MYTED|nr:unnamed protein product [Mytilus edulis]